ncbi:hypothetical protein [Shewanella algae]|uniref:MuF-C-terminal domain-containing protein n=1 Tax=Shewanella algae TaxID=38313 RepID=UPI0031F57757
MNNFSALVDLIIKSEIDGTPKHEQVLFLGTTPPYLVEHAGFDLNPLIIKGKTISKICFDHGVKTSVIKRLPEIIQKPKSVFAPALEVHRDSVVVLTFELHRGAPIIIPVKKNVKVGRGATNYNIVTSTYAKDGGDIEQRWRDEKLLIWEP